MINWKRKLTSRKWWLAVTGVVIAILEIFYGTDKAHQIGGIILLIADVVAYTLAEAYIDAQLFNAELNGQQENTQDIDK